MTIIRRFSDSTEKRINKFLVDESNEYLWIVYNKAATVIHLKKVSAHNPDQVYFDIEITGENDVIDLKQDSSSVYLLFDGESGTLIKEYSKSNPLTSVTTYTKPYNIPMPLEMGIATGSSEVIVLLPDYSGGVTPKLLVYTTSGTFSETVDLDSLLSSSEVMNEVISMTIDSNDNIWIVTHTDPVKLFRIWFASGGWRKQLTNMT